MPISHYSHFHTAAALLVVLLVWTTLESKTHAGVVTTSLTSSALEGNPWGNSASRKAEIYLPPSYDSSSKHYPVIYYLHGGGSGGNENSFINRNGGQSANDLIASGMMNEMIVVGIDASTTYAGANYYNSELLGNYEDYIVQEVVSHIDANFRTRVDRDSRGLIGYSRGGDGALRYGMYHSDVFGAVYMISAPIINTFSQPDSLMYLGGDTVVFLDELLEALNISDPGDWLNQDTIASDNDIDGADFLIWQRGFGTPAPNATKSDGDADGDLEVDGDDLVVWEGQFGVDLGIEVASTEVSGLLTSVS